MDRIFRNNLLCYLIALNLFNKLKLICVICGRDEIINIILFTENILLRVSASMLFRKAQGTMV